MIVFAVPSATFGHRAAAAARTGGFWSDHREIAGLDRIAVTDRPMARAAINFRHLTASLRFVGTVPWLLEVVFLARIRSFTRRRQSATAQLCIGLPLASATNAGGR